MLARAGEKDLEFVLPLRMPARKRRPVGHDVLCGPEDAPLVLLAGCLIVLTENVKLVAGKAVQQAIGDLFGLPGR